ncbi:hypothetical protein [Dactylosporangium sp. CS-033363]|uniref:hypothetical protein n=1 Tax=Dactylosporangium sp. CS-033363 TaxID=3239935 RepID=UPI003D90F9AD
MREGARSRAPVNFGVVFNYRKSMRTGQWDGRLWTEGVELEPSALVPEENLTANNGKLGYLKIARLNAISDELSPSVEISEARWTAVDLTDLPGNPAVSKWALSALKAQAQA